jgi:hypothetical protein
LRLFASLLFGFAFAAASASSTPISEAFRQKRWNEFFSLAYEKRLELKERLQKSEQISAADLSSLVLEASAYIRMCYPESALRILGALRSLSSRFPSEELTNDLNSLERIAQQNFSAKIQETRSTPEHGALRQPRMAERWILPPEQRASLKLSPSLRGRLAVKITSNCAKETASK